MAPSPLESEVARGTYRAGIRIRCAEPHGNGDVMEVFVSGVTVKWRYPPRAFSLWTWPSGVPLTEGEEADELWQLYGSWTNIDRENMEHTARAGVQTPYIKLLITDPGEINSYGRWTTLREIEVFIPDEQNIEQGGATYYANKALNRYENNKQNLSFKNVGNYEKLRLGMEGKAACTALKNIPRPFPFFKMLFKQNTFDLRVHVSFAI